MGVSLHTKVIFVASLSEPHHSMMLMHACVYAEKSYRCICMSVLYIIYHK